MNLLFHFPLQFLSLVWFFIRLLVIASVITEEMVIIKMILVIKG